MTDLPDCFFFTYADEQGIQKIAPLCVECRSKEPELQAMFWPGSVRGYKADAKFSCKKCELVLHEIEDEDVMEHTNGTV